MAVHALLPARSPANTDCTAFHAALGRSRPAAGDPLTHMLTLAALMPRKDIERTIDAMIEALDTADGDTDCEVDDDDGCSAGDDDPTRCNESWANDDDSEEWFVPAHWPAGCAA